MPTNLFHQLHILSQAITDFPMFHWFRVIGFSAAVGYALVWFATSWWGFAPRWKVTSDLAGGMALVSLALCAVGWLAGELAVLALLSVPIAPFVLMLHARVARDPFNVWKTPLEDV